MMDTEVESILRGVFRGISTSKGIGEVYDLLKPYYHRMKEKEREARVQLEAHHHCPKCGYTLENGREVRYVH